MKIEQEIIRSVFDAYIKDIKAVNEKHEPTIDMLEEVKNRAIKALGQNTVSEEVYNDEYTARKQAEYELWKIKEQQPSDDCVSRQAVKEGMIKYGFHAPDMTVTEFIEDELPPVTPKIPTSEDCVSRKAVLDTLMKYEKPCDDRQDFYLDSTTEFEEEIKELPPVTPTHKVGKWIYDRGSYKCPFCEHEITGKENDLNYCCKCGAEMKGESNNDNT